MERNELQALDANFRAGNYLSAAQLFLNSNVDISELKQEDLKKVVLGHWGCCPAINYLYSHINRFINKTKIEPKIIIGSGHSSPALISNLYLNGTLGEMYPEYRHGTEGINNLIGNFGKNMILQTEISPLLPNVILAGGELGNAISTGMGTIINNMNQTTFTIVGDGEFEAGTTISSLLCNQIINSNNDGFLVVIINLNGYKMTSRSLISLNDNFEEMLENFGYKVFSISINNNEKTAKVFDSIIELQKRWYRGENCKMPIVILKSPKGFSAPKVIGELNFVNSHLSHKVSILKHPAKVKNSLETIKVWLSSYNPEELFINGVPTKKVLDNIPKIEGRRVKEKKLNNSKFNIYDLPTNEMEALSMYFDLSANRDFLIFSPDESLSNGLKGLVDKYGLRYNVKKGTKSSIKLKDNGKVIEILNEVICITMLYGYLKSGGDGIFITYEAFAPLISSFLSQCYKFYKQQNKIKQRTNYKSLKIIITSLGWRNTYTHQNPDILNTLLSKESKYIKVYFPSDSKQAVYCFKEMEQANDCIRVLYVTKTTLNTFRTVVQAQEDVKKGYWIQKNDNTANSNRILLIAIGDIMTNECLQVSKKITDINIDVLSIIKSDCIENFDIDIKEYQKILVYCTGYCDIIRGKMSNKYDTTKWLFKGYNDSIYGTYKNVLQSNRVDVENIIKDIKGDCCEF